MNVYMTGATRSRNFHEALKQEILAEARSNHTGFRLVKHWWGKNDIAYSLHASLNSYSTAGIQKADLLNYLGFKLKRCSFLNGSLCYVRWVLGDFNVDDFAKSFEASYVTLTESEKDLRQCGFSFDQPEGWNYFSNGTGSSRPRRESYVTGDGHVGASNRQIRESEDGLFFYKFTWIKNGHEKYWTIHYYPKQPTLLPELPGVFKFLGIQQYRECPERDFEPCYWRSVPFRSSGPRYFDENTEDVNKEFNSHAQFFSSGIQKLISANAEMEKFDFSFLPGIKPKRKQEQKVSPISNQTKTQTTATAENTANVAIEQEAKNPTTYEVAISFAKTERVHARNLVKILKAQGVSVFFDELYPEKLWGSDLVKYLASVFEKESRYCVIFVSKDYKERAWPNHELRSAQARALEDRGGYILPIQVDDTKLDGLPSTIGYLPIADGIEKIAKILITKLRS